MTDTEWIILMMLGALGFFTLMGLWAALYKTSLHHKRIDRLKEDMKAVHKSLAAIQSDHMHKTIIQHDRPFTDQWRNEIRDASKTAEENNEALAGMYEAIGKAIMAEED